MNACTFSFQFTQVCQCRYHLNLNWEAILPNYILGTRTVPVMCQHNIYQYIFILLPDILTVVVTIWLPSDPGIFPESGVQRLTLQLYSPSWDLL